MDSVYWFEVISMGLRWLHVIVAIAWIGSSFYFIWLDNSIRPPTDEALKEKGVLGELWAMHAGGFYNPQKYVVAPKQLPEKLHWFFWPSYSTFLTGFLLISTLYYMQAGSFMIDPAKSSISANTSILIGLGTLVGGWIVYDLLCRLLIEKSQLIFAVIYTLFVTLVAWTLDQFIAGRAMYLHVGAMMASTMTANVFFIIIPGQRKIVGAMKRNEIPDSKPGKRAKQRSIHNNYITLPVLFCMISNHYSFTYNHPQGWIVLIVILIASTFIRHFFNLKHKDYYGWQWLMVGGVMLLGVFLAIAPAPKNDVTPVGRDVSTEEMTKVMTMRCVGCHSEKPTLVGSAPAGILLDNPDRLKMYGNRVYRQVCRIRAMPLGNVTQMTDEERGIVAKWIITQGLK